VNVNDDLPSLSIQDTALTGNVGSTSFVFTVTLSEPANTASVGYTTQNGTGERRKRRSTASDLSSFRGTLSQRFVAATGETLVEADETFFVDLAGAIGAHIADGRGIGTILNDDAPSVGVSKTSLAMGELVQVTIADGPGNRTDWVVLAKVGTGVSSYLDWKYLSGSRSLPPTGLTSAVLTFAMPATLKPRFFLTNSRYNLWRPGVARPPIPVMLIGNAVARSGTVADGPAIEGDWWGWRRWNRRDELPD
jgi:hypothetical protein